jgi:class 3 adenylate cyclase/alpha-beta hydrolase superfamily lysophospholipase
VESPETRYARSGALDIAYQVTGEGPVDLVLIPGFVSNVELTWEDTAKARFMRHLASFSRLILFDKRGTGVSDRVPVDQLPSLEERMDDVRAVMDAAGSERATMFGLSEGGPMSILFAATYPARVERLVLYGAFAKRLTAEPDGGAEMIRLIESSWGNGAVLAGRSGGAADDPVIREQLARTERQSATPSAAAALIRMAAQIDVRAVCGALSVPTLIIHRTGDPVLNVAASRELNAMIRGAHYVELEGAAHLPWVGDSNAVLEEIEEFMTGLRHGPPVDRVLSTIMFTDIVESTQTAARLGDRSWRSLLDDHDSITRREVERFRGRVIKSTGDGALATFDGPARAVRCATAIRDALSSFGLQVRVGVHTGEIELRGDDVGGMAVHICARVGALAAPGEVLVTETVTALVAGSGLSFSERGAQVLKGVPGKWQIFALDPA